ncbi:MAG: hypothetical protein GY809_29075 [Planctomycetes bacterium]|nr:hypothetical protein [Planctomycetota bacterium]
MALGALIIGVLNWHAAKPEDPAGLVNLQNLSVIQGLLLLGLAAALGFAGYFIAWPYGCEIGLLAAPSGLAIWACRSASVSRTLAVIPDVHARQDLFASMRFEAIYWLAVVYAGWCGVRLAKKLRPNPTLPILETLPGPRQTPFLYNGLALVLSVVVGQFLVGVFAQDIPLNHGALTQPPSRQLALGIFMAFGVAAFLVGHFLHLTYHWVMPALALTYGLSTLPFAKAETLTLMAQTSPSLCLPSTVLFALPIHIVAFGSLGAIWGHWASVRFDYWRAHELH